MSGPVRDYGRLMLALGFALVFAATVLFALAIALWGSDQAMGRVTEILHLVLPAEMALLGAATTFYFAGAARPGDDGR